LQENKIPSFEREGWLCQPSLSKLGILLIRRSLRSTYEIKPGIFDEKRGNAALLIKNSGFYFIFSPKAISRKEYPHFLREGAAQPRPLSKMGIFLFQITKITTT